MTRTLQIACIVSISVIAASFASAEIPSLGDVNGDGSINVLDVQGAIAQALQLVPQNLQGDLDATGSVDITDVQNLINTALGTGGLVQRLTGQIAAAAELLQSGVQVIAISQDGDEIVVDVDGATGQFSITLPVKEQWWLAIVAELDGVTPEAFPLNFPLDGNFSTLLPLLDLSQCDVLDLGSLNFGEYITVPEDLRTLLGEINNDQFLLDADGNEIPDFLDSLLLNLNSAPAVPGLPINLSLVIPDLIELIQPCIETHLPDLTTVTLVNGNADNMLDFIEPLFQCLRENMLPWLNDFGFVIPEPYQQLLVDTVLGYLEGELPEWMDTLESLSLEDANGNGIPDYIEAYLADIPLPAWVDANGNGVPDFLEAE